MPINKALIGEVCLVIRGRNTGKLYELQVKYIPKASGKILEVRQILQSTSNGKTTALLSEVEYKYEGYPYPNNNREEVDTKLVDDFLGWASKLTEM